jgi:hypothetical protein
MANQSDDETPIDWSVRLERVRNENQRLFEFVHGGEIDGTISKEASQAFFRASVSAMNRAGIAGPSMKGEDLGDAVMCTVVAQSLHEGRQALLKVQPDLSARLAAEVPSTRSGRSGPSI